LECAGLGIWIVEESKVGDDVDPSLLCSPQRSEKWKFSIWSGIGGYI